MTRRARHRPGGSAKTGWRGLALRLAACAALACPIARPAAGAEANGVSATFLSQVKLAQPGLVAVQVRINLVDPKASQAVGGRSLYVAAIISCEAQTNLVQRLRVFPGPDLKGGGADYHPPAGWIRPAADAYMAALTRQTCAEAFPAKAALTPVRTAPAQVRAAGPAPASIPTVAPPAGAVSASVVQIAASPSAQQARGALAHARRLVAGTATLQARVRPAKVGGRTVFRAQLAGFASLSSARAFCTRLRSAGGLCLVKVS